MDNLKRSQCIQASNVGFDPHRPLYQNSSSRATVLYPATFLRGPLHLHGSRTHRLINTNRILADVVGAQRDQFTSAQPDAEARRNRVEYGSRRFWPMLWMCFTWSEIRNVCSGRC